MANNSYLQPWMVGVIKSSLPYLLYSGKIQEVLEEARGSIGADISKLLDVLRGKRKGDIGKREPTCISISGRID